MTPDDRRLEETLRAANDDYIRKHPADLHAARTKLHRLRRRRQLRMGGIAAFAGAAAVAIAVYALPGLMPADEAPGPAAPDRSAPSFTRVDVDGTPTELAVGDDAMWVSNAEGGSVTRIDLETKETLEIQVGGEPSDLAIGESGLWVAIPELGLVQSIDTESVEATPDMETPVGDPGSNLDLAIDDFLWVSVVGRELVQVNPVSGELVRELPDIQPVNVAARADRLFVLETNGTVVELDPTSGAETDASWQFPIEDRGDVHYDRGTLWVAAADGSEVYSADANDASADVVTHQFEGTYIEMVLTEETATILSKTSDETGRITAFSRSTGAVIASFDILTLPRDMVRVGSDLWISNAEAGNITILEGVL